MDEVVENESLQRFELHLGDGDVAVSYYRLHDGIYELRHTEVPQHRSGQGAGSTLARGVFELVRQRGMRAHALCPFMAAYAARHEEARAVLAR